MKTLDDVEDTPLRRLLSAGEIGDLANIPASTITAMARDGAIPVWKFGRSPRSWRFDPIDVREVLRAPAKAVAP